MAYTYTYIKYRNIKVVNNFAPTVLRFWVGINFYHNVASNEAFCQLILGREMFLAVMRINGFSENC